MGVSPEPDPLDPRAALAAGRRIVVKVGTAVVARPDGRLALGRIAHLVEQLHALQAAGRQVVLVSSGAVGLGAERLGFDRPPTAVVDRQACAAAGQGALVATYDTLLGRLGGRCAQVLLTEEDFHVRRRHVNLAATLDRLLGLGVLPIVNENDTVSTAEIALHGPTVFGDNDRLGALVAAGIGADALVLLTDVDGVYDRPPAEPGAQRLSVWSGEDVRLGTASSLGRGGMGAKLASAGVAARAGVPVVVASGHDPTVLGRLFAGEDVGTVVPATGTMSSKRRWLAFASAPQGRLSVNDGARRALIEEGASLLAIGVDAVDGAWDAGAIVSIVDARGEEFARGRCDRSAEDLRALLARGAPRGRALVHRDHVVLFEEGR